MSFKYPRYLIKPICWEACFNIPCICHDNMTTWQHDHAYSRTGVVCVHNSTAFTTKAILFDAFWKHLETWNNMDDMDGLGLWSWWAGANFRVAVDNLSVSSMTRKCFTVNDFVFWWERFWGGFCYSPAPNCYLWMTMSNWLPSYVFKLVTWNYEGNGHTSSPLWWKWQDVTYWGATWESAPWRIEMCQHMAKHLWFTWSRWAQGRFMQWLSFKFEF